jgi:HSP20 family protein
MISAAFWRVSEGIRKIVPANSKKREYPPVWINCSAYGIPYANRYCVVRGAGNKKRRCEMSVLLPVRRETTDLWDTASDIETVFDVLSPFETRRLIRDEGLWHPTMDVYDRKDELVVELEIPGMKPEEVDIKVQENHLIVEGSLKRANEYSDKERCYCERSYGKFHRVVHLPATIDEANVKASFDNGILTIRLPKKAKEGGKKIKVEAA